MAFIQDGAVTATLAGVGATQLALRTSLRPPEAVTTLGAYKQGLFTGSMAAGLAANSEIMQFRYPGTQICLVKSVRMDTVCASTAFAAGALSFRLLLATAWTVDAAGGQAASTASEAGQTDSRFAIPVATFRVATTAAMGAGTKTLQGVTANSQGLGINLGFTAPATPAVGLQMPAADLFVANTIYSEPIALQPSEGLVVVATVPGTGVWVTGFTIEWVEISAANWR